MAQIEIEKQHTLNYEGEKGSSLIFRPLIQSLDKELFDEMQKKTSHFLKRYKDTSDERALALIGALTIENELDYFLSSWIKKYKNIEDNLTFSFKVNLAISLNLIPNKIFNSIEPIRRIRNIFAHNLDIDSFEKAKEYDSKSEKSTFLMLHNKLESFGFKETLDDKDAFEKLIFLIIVGLNIYTKHIAKIQEYVWNSEKLQIIMET